VIERCHLASDPNQTARSRKRRELFWIWELKTITPAGINHMVRTLGVYSFLLLFYTAPFCSCLANAILAHSSNFYDITYFCDVTHCYYTLVM
jgi:hypothetical protein